MQEVADGTQSLRGLYPHVNAAKSFLESSKSQSGSGDEKTYSMVSIVSEKIFEFDDFLTSSQVYRRVLIAATHTPRNTKSENFIPNRDSSQIPLNRTNSNEDNPTGTNTANQGRKIRPSVPPRNGLPPIAATEIHIDPALRMNTTHSDAFLQQSRECNDPLEGDLGEATDMTMKLRETVQQRDTEINRLESDFQSSVAKVPEADLQLEQALARERQHSAECQPVFQRLQAELDKYRKLYNDAFADIHSVRRMLQAQEVKCKTLELNLTTSQSETEVVSEEMQRHKEEAQLHKENSQRLRKDAQRHERERVEMVRKIESELRISFELRTWNTQQLLQESRDELRCSERDLVTTRQQRDAFQKRFNFLRCQSQQLLKASKDDLLSIEEKLVAIRQERDSLQKKWNLTRIQSRRLLRESRYDLHEANNKLILARQETDSVQERLTATTHQFHNMLQKKEKDHDRVRLTATTLRFRNRLQKKEKDHDIMCARLAVLEQHAQGYEALKRVQLQERQQDRETERTRRRQQIKDAEVLSWADLLHHTTLFSIIVLCAGLIIFATVGPTVNFRREVDLTASCALSPLSNSDFMTGLNNHTRIEIKTNIPPAPPVGLKWVAGSNSNGLRIAKTSHEEVRATSTSPALPRPLYSPPTAVRVFTESPISRSFQIWTFYLSRLKSWILTWIGVSSYFFRWPAWFWKVVSERTASNHLIHFRMKQSLADFKN
jgi:hypothetical protein